MNALVVYIVVFSLCGITSSEARKCKAIHGECCRTSVTNRPVCRSCEGRFVLGVHTTYDASEQTTSENFETKGDIAIMYSTFIKQASRLRSKTCSDLRCFPCVPFPSGPYRLYHSVLPSFSKWILQCPELHRLTSRECGKDTGGECGACEQGYKAGLSNSLTESCVKITFEVTAGDKEVTQPKSQADVVHTTYMYIIPLILGCMTGGLLRLAVVYAAWYRKKQQIDEIKQLIQEALAYRRKDAMKTRFNLRDFFNSIIVSENDACVTDIAYHLCDQKKVCAFFKSLNIAEARYIPQLEHWFANKRNKSDNYEHIMLDVLKHWCHKEAPNTTLYKLLEALWKAGFTELSERLIHQYIAEIPRGSHDTQINNGVRDGNVNTIKLDIEHQMENLKHHDIISQNAIYHENDGLLSTKESHTPGGISQTDRSTCTCIAGFIDYDTTPAVVVTEGRKLVHVGITDISTVLNGENYNDKDTRKLVDCYTGNVHEANYEMVAELLDDILFNLV